MKQAVAVAVLLGMAAVPSFAAADLQQLLQALVAAARKGDVQGFLANTSRASQRALAEAEAAQKKLDEAQKNFQAALDQRFGEGHGATSSAPRGRKTVLGRLVSLELLSVQQKSPDEALLRMKTSSKDTTGRVIAEEDTFTAVREGGKWKVVLTNLAEGASQIAAARADIFAQVTNQVRRGDFKDRVSAMVALANAERASMGRRPSK